ncbi:Methyltransferase type 11 [Candidatus Zixiibacteriota bacterium]|nr:Methyltransferase type 11 [candidate division Zixibacteria bacterium]
MKIRLKAEETMRLYRDLSWLWPIISPPETYIDEGEFFIEKIKECSPGAKTLLNLGCGGGHLDSVLKRAFDITGIDINPQMLLLARKLNPEVEYLLDDMRIARMNREFNAAIIHDASVHMETLEELKAAFLTAYMHLKKDGRLITYVEEWPEHFVQNRTVVENFKKDNIEVTYIENNYDPDSDDENYECTFVYLIRREGFLDLQTDRYILGLFPVRKWIEALEEIGFEVTVGQFAPSKMPDAASSEKYPLLVARKK